jgi:hypothetical protein
VIAAILLDIILSNAIDLISYINFNAFLDRNQKFHGQRNLDG